MNLQTFRLTLVVALAVLALAVSSSFAQNDYGVVPITARDNGIGVGTDTFGVHINATYCKDATLSPGGYFEEELPPKPPTGVFDFRFTDHRTSGPCLGTGQRLHIQEVAKLDTFKMEFQPSDGGYPFTFSWGTWAAWIASDWDSLKIEDPFGAGPPFGFRVNMLVDTQLIVTNSAFTSLIIIGRSKGAGLLEIDREGELIPEQFELQQNYPNPFNPSTTIRFAVEKTAFTDVAVYNVIGQRVKTLAAETMTPGFYTTTWNGTDDNGQSVTTGVYFVRMVATGDDAGFSGLRKLLLLK